MNNTKSQETVKHTPQFKAKLYCGSTFGESTEATLNLEGSGIHHSDLAVFVTKAVNCHDDLLEACKVALDLVRVARDHFPKSMHDADKFKLENTCATIGKAIEKASAQ